jgi:protein TonB
MNRPFYLSAAIAGSAHAVLLFGFPKMPRPERVIACGAEPPPFVCGLPVELEPPKEMDAKRTDRFETKADRRALAPPRSAEETPDKISITDLLMPPAGPQPTRTHPGERIVPSNNFFPEGDPNNKDEGGGGGVIWRPSQLDNVPRTRVQTPPVYPRELMARGVSGEVVVEFLVDETGRVREPRVLSSTHREFEAPTLAAVAQWRFEPGTRNLTPVRFRMSVPVRFGIAE